MIGILLAVILALVIGYIVFSLQPEEQSEDVKLTKTRLNKIKNKEYDTPSSKAIISANKGLMQAIMTDDEYSIKFLGKFLEKFNLFHSLKKVLKLAEMKIDVSQFITMIALVGAGLSVMLYFVGPTAGNIPAAVLFGIILSIVPPAVIIKLKIKKRLDKFTNQLPDALGLMSSALRAGHSLPSAFSIVVVELPSPVCSVFRTACEDINLGRSTKEALENMVANMPGSIDLRFFVTAVLIQREIGGNLAEILDSLNNTIRERFKLLGQLKSQTAQASLSGIVLALAPAVIGGIIYVLNPSYMEPLFTHPLGKVAIGAAVFLGVVGFLIIKKITTIRV